MSPNVGNFVHDLVEMAKAMETLPQVEAERDRLQADLTTAQETVRSREERIIGLKSEIETLQSKIRTTEAERDDAELRFLELDDKSAKVASFLGQIQGLAVQADLLLNPPKPQPEPTPAPQEHSFSGWTEKNPESAPSTQSYYGLEPIPPQAQGDSASHPTDAAPSQPVAASPTTESQSAPSDSMGKSALDPTGTSSAGESQSSPSGQSEAAPTADTSPVQPTAPTDPAPTQAVGSTGGEGGGDKPQPYAGRNYYDYPSWVNRDDWKAGGGTDWSYDWRPSQRNNVF